MPNINFRDFSLNYMSMLKRPELVYIGKLDDELTWKSEKFHAHQGCCEIMLVVQGNGFVYVNNERFEFHCGNIIVYNSNSKHLEDLSFSEQPPKLYYALIKNIFIEGLYPHCLIPEGVCPVLDGLVIMSTIRALYEQMFLECTEKELGYFTVCNGLLQSLLINVIRLISSRHQLMTHRETPIQQKILEYIENNYMNRINLADIANNFYVSQFYLVHIFKKYFGQSPIDYLIRYRMEQAANFLKTTGYSITKVASMVGYDNPSYFGNSFKKLYNCTPRQYRDHN